MKKKETRSFFQEKLYKPLLIMKITFLILMVSAMQMSASVYSQNTKLNVNLSNQNLVEVFKEIRNNSEFTFVYDMEDVESVEKVTLSYQGATVEKILDECLKNTNLTYEVVDKVIIVKQKPYVASAQQEDKRLVSGTVVDEKGLPLPGVNIVAKGKGYGTITNEEGVFAFDIIDDTKVLVFSFIGYETKEVDISEQKLYSVVLRPVQNDLDEVVVTGLFERRKDTYTGNISSVKGEVLLEYGKENILKSLNQLDPSFQILESNDFGSDPNKLPEIRFRGASSFENQILSESSKNLLKTDPNQPTFILDGFRVGLEDIIDLDMHLIESVTILKDAVAASIYGSQSANGVFVIKTKAPISGAIRVSYSTNMSVLAPDLDTYELLDGPELLEYQENLGLYGDDVRDSYDNYNQIKQWIYEGVDSDWKWQPVQNVFMMQHSINLSGGDSSVRYSLSLNYDNNEGVMIGSSRNNLSSVMNLSYSLNDRLNFSANISVTRNKAKGSPYGNFSDYINMPNYFPMSDENGDLIEVIGVYGGQRIVNPLVEAEAGNYSEEKYISVRNNFGMNWRFTDHFMLNAAVGYAVKNDNSQNFISPNSIRHDWSSALSEEEKGLLTVDNTETETINSNIMLNYSRGFKEHMFTSTVGTILNENRANLVGMVAQGFSDDKHFPTFANGYEIDGNPRGEEILSRQIGLLASFNYSFKDTYLLDASYRLDGSSMFGSDNRFAPFFSIGTGINFSNMAFVKNTSWIDNLRINATYGEMGSVSFAPYQAKDMFTYHTNSRYRGNVGLYLRALGNDNLVWQTTKSKEVYCSVSLFKRLIDLNVSVYDRRTIDMITPVTLPSSAGFTSMEANLGEMSNKGVEVSFRSVLYSRNNANVVFNMSGGHNVNKIESLGGGLKDYNNRIKDEAESSLPGEQTKFISQFQEGQSLNTFYAVRSLGIDPHTGQELFLDRNGEPTWVWSSQDMVPVGRSTPKVEGSIGLSAAYKRLFMSMNGMYRYGGQVYNATLLDRVENSNKWLNQDYRVKEQAWQKPGDIASYRSVMPGDATTKASTRFIQDNNTFQISSISLGYSFSEKVCDKLRVDALSLGTFFNDVFYTSTVKRERGINYPFARTMGLSLSTNF